ncbi:uncharacterized protein DNG_09036 [Cephalotrichum gorgonifer]|uniref:HNH nuclease domain-containing protein n=1 Tax=Cephalotrichum gorgonifer TaxID=2041049 RepID=A0AAE8SZT0_9PEZI|nr:uncharacterized protein DNG_09036 [Cephalotrichum gorgonifer]
MAFPASVSPHPSPSALSDYVMSSAPYSVTEYADLQETALTLLHQYPPTSEEDATQRVLQAALEHLPVDGRTTMMMEISLLGENWAQIRQLSQFFTDAVLKPMRLQRSPPSIPPSPSSDAAPGISTLMSLLETSTRARQSTLKAACLRRDGYRCALSNRIESEAVLEGHVLQGDRQVCSTKCAHILPFGLRKIDEGDSLDMEREATIWWALFRYFPSLHGIIAAETINQVENTITLETDMHNHFDAFRITLEPSHACPNVYNIHNFTSISGLVPETATMRSQDPKVPLPRPEFFQVHFTVASILDVTGLGARMNAFLDPEFWEEAHGHAKADGSTDLATLVERKMLIGI